MKKLKSTRGETLVETLVSLLIIVLTFAFLTTSAITAAKINAKVRQRDVSFRYSDAGSAHIHFKSKYSYQILAHNKSIGEKQSLMLYMFQSI